MNVKIGAEAALFPEKEYINGIAVAVCQNFFPYFLRTFQKYLFLNLTYNLRTSIKIVIYVHFVQYYRRRRYVINVFHWFSFHASLNWLDFLENIFIKSSPYSVRLFCPISNALWEKNFLVSLRWTWWTITSASAWTPRSPSSSTRPGRPTHRSSGKLASQLL